MLRLQTGDFDREEFGHCLFKFMHTIHVVCPLLLTQWGSVNLVKRGPSILCSMLRESVDHLIVLDLIVKKTVHSSVFSPEEEDCEWLRPDV
jgi:hypothetical protein